MTGPDITSDALAAALIQISEHAERIRGIDDREATHYTDIASRLRDLASLVSDTSTQANQLTTTVRHHDTILASLDGLDTQVATLATHLAELATHDQDSDGYQPVPPPRWWKLTGEDRGTALDRLRAWVDHIYLPSYGQLAATLPPCWEQHPTCLYILDWLSELWSLLYLNPHRDGRTLAAQAEWHTRILPAAASQMAAEATGCHHAHTPNRASSALTRSLNRSHPGT